MYVRRATIADVADISTLLIRAMSGDGLWKRLHPGREEHPHDFRRTVLRRQKARFYNGCTVYVAVTDESDSEWDGRERAVAMMAMSPSSSKPKTYASIEQIQGLATGAWNKFNLLLQSIEEQYIWYFNLDKSVDKAQAQRFRGQVAASNTLDEYEPYWYVELFATDPDFQRRGLAGRLIEEAKNIGQDDKMPVCLHASVSGRPFYTSKGFKGLGKEAEGDAMIWLPT